MELQPRLLETDVPAHPVGVVLVLHGGGSRRGNMMVSPTQLSVLRMIPIAHQVAKAGGGQLAVFRLLNTKRGWDATTTPVQDVRWALDQVTERFGPGCRPASSATRLAVGPRSWRPERSKYAAPWRWRRGCIRATATCRWAAVRCWWSTAPRTGSPRSTRLGR